MSIVRVPEGAIALRAACPRCHAEPHVACTRSGGSVITALDGRSSAGLTGTLYVCEDRLLPSLLCDFCGRDGVRWIAPARDFEPGYRDVGGRWVKSAGDWLACQTCGELISLAKRGTLLERAVGHHLSRMESGGRRRTAGALRVALSDQFDLFWSNRDGPVRLVTMAEVRDAAVKIEDEVIEISDPPKRIAPWWSGLRPGGA